VGFTASAIALSVVVTGIWNMFMKLGLPVAALAILAIEGRAGGGLLVAALIGVAILMAAVVLFALMLWKKALPRRIGDALGRGAAFLLRLVRKPSVGDWGERAVRFRRQTIDLVAGRGAPHAHDRDEPSRLFVVLLPRSVTWGSRSRRSARPRSWACSPSAG